MSSYASPVPPSFDCSCPNGMAGGLDQCLVCANLIDCAYRRKIMSGSEVREKSPASSLSAAEMPVEKQLPLERYHVVQFWHFLRVGAFIGFLDGTTR